MWEEWTITETAAERPYWLALSTLMGIRRISNLIAHYGSLSVAWRSLSWDVLRQIPLFSDELAQQVLRSMRTLEPRTIEQQLVKQGSRVLIPPEPDYPELLRHAPGAPATLYIRGHYDPTWLARSVAVVGTRQPSGNGAHIARQLAGDLARNGLTVVSGMALGIDAAAHQGALAVPQGRTIAVLGCGTDIVAPPSHRSLYAKICERGLVVSEYPDGTPPAPSRFPPRNRIISGLSAGVIIVEAPEQSGALITADFAAEQGREVFAVPGSILERQSQGGHKLLRDGARLVTGAADVLDELGWGAPVPARQSNLSLPSLTAAEEGLYSLLNNDPQSVERLIERTRLPAGELASVLIQLEVKGVVRRMAGSKYVRSH